MKTILLLLLALSTQATASTYSCENRTTVQIQRKASKLSVRLTVPSMSGKRLITIRSGDSTDSADFASTSDSKPLSLISPTHFFGFHYANGQMYVSEEGDTNEQGFTLSLDQSAILGSKTAKIALNYWIDFMKTEEDISYLNCVRIK